MIAGIATIALIVFAANQAASARGFTFSQNQFAQESRDGTTILARGLTSIPFGIQDELTLFGDGQTVRVQGHGDCYGGEDFNLKVTLSSPNSFDGLAVGHTKGQCTNVEEYGWEVEVKAPGPKTFTSGDAQACGHVVIHREGQGDFVSDWCKKVALVVGSP